MSRPDRPARPRPPVRRPAASAVAAAAPPSRTALWIGALAVAAVLASAVSFQLFEPDFWQHLAVGRAIWQLHRVPDRQVWTWPTYGTPDVTPSWLFRVLLWPLWSAAGVWGLLTWRWATTLGAFGLAWATARRMGARGLAALAVVLLCGVSYRVRSQIRPETLVAVLLALEIWCLESRRSGGPDRSPWVVAIAWVWVNTHLSYPLGMLVLGAYTADAWLRARGARAEAGPGRLVWILLASVAASFLHPSGLRGLAQPFDYFLHLRHEPLFAGIRELQPPESRDLLLEGWIVPIVAWPVLILIRGLRRRADWVEILLCLTMTWLALQSRRFIGFYLVGAAPFLMRDVEERLASLRIAGRVPLPVRVALLLGLCVVAGAREWTRPDPRIGVAIDYENVPVHACDFMAEQGIRGRGFNPFPTGGYLLYRFWPDRARLPFMDIHASGGPEVRLAYRNALQSADGWRALNDRYRFDYVITDRFLFPADPFLDVLDADTSLALVFADDAAVVFVSRRGDLGPVAARNAYRVLPAGRASLPAIFQRCARDTAFRDHLLQELERRAGSSPRNAQTLDLLANLALDEGRLDDARSLLERALGSNPWLPRAHERLGLVALVTGRPRVALREFETERSLDPARPGVALRLGQAWQRLGNAGAARRWYQREVALHPESQEALDSLRALDRP